MGEVNSASQPDRSDKRSSSSDAGTAEGASAEMRRQMEAAKERMKRYHAVYGQAAHGFDGRQGDSVNRSED
jgi:hypothetical protein